MLEGGNPLIINNPITVRLTRVENLSGTAIFDAMGKNIKSPPDLSVRQGQMGDGSSPLSLSRTDIRRTLAGLPVSRRHSPRQAEFSAS